MGAAVASSVNGSVVIIDDDPFSINVFTHIAEQLGLRTVGANSPKCFSDEQLVASDVIVLDLMMPEVDGIQWLRRLAELGVRARIVVTSGASKRVLRHALAAARSYGLNIGGTVSKSGDLEDFRRLLTDTQPSRSHEPPGTRNEAAPTLEDVRDGLHHEEFEVVLQPKVGLQDGVWRGNEVLARWKSSKFGYLMPGQFIEIIEDSPIAAEFTLAMIDLGLQATKALSDALGFSGGLAVNVPPAALKSVVLTESIMALLSRHDLNPQRLTLELTERQALLGTTISLDIQSRLAMRGLRLSVDDFGVGQASMERLHDALFDELKIDKSFVDGVVDDSRSRVLVESMVGVAHKLEMVVVAEGIEDVETARVMRDLGCDTAQGYYFCRPVSLEELLSDSTLVDFSSIKR